jgi:hypothetical protein
MIPTPDTPAAPGLYEAFYTLAVEAREKGGYQAAAVDRLPGVREQLVTMGVNEKQVDAILLGIALGMAISEPGDVSSGPLDPR